MIGRRWMQSPRCPLTRFPSALSGVGRGKRVTPARTRRRNSACRWVGCGRRDQPRNAERGRDGTRPDAEARSLASSGARSPRCAADPGHFSPFFYHRPPPFVLLIEFFSFEASRRRAAHCATCRNRASDTTWRNGRARYEEKRPAVNYRAPNLKYIPVYRLIQPSDVTFFSFAG